MSAELTRYLVWTGVVAAGALLAVVDRRWIGRPVCGVLLVAGVGAGFVIEEVSPFSFGGGSHYMEGVLVSAGSALGLIGYVLAAIWQFVRRRIGGRRALLTPRLQRRTARYARASRKWPGPWQFAILRSGLGSSGGGCRSID